MPSRRLLRHIEFSGITVLKKVNLQLLQYPPIHKRISPNGRPVPSWESGTSMKRFLSKSARKKQETDNFMDVPYVSPNNRLQKDAGIETLATSPALTEMSHYHERE